MTAVRFTFVYRGDEVWVAGWAEVSTVAPLSAPMHDLGDRSGFWCELRDAGGSPLHRQVLRDPRHPTDEVPGDRPTPTGGLRHVPSRAVESVFTVLVPALPTAATLALVQRRATDDAPIDVLRHDLG